MRDARPLVLDFVIHDQFRPEVFPNKTFVQRIQGRRVQRLAPFRHRVGFPLKFREHGLAVHRALEVLQILIEQIHPHGGVLLLLEKLLDQQVLVDGGSHLGHKQRIIRVLGRLVVVGQPGVQAVAHLMRDRGNAVQCARKVGEDIGVRVIGAGRISAAALALVGEHVDPAVRKGPAHHAAIVRPQRRDGIQHHLLRLLIGVAHLHFRCQRRIDIIVVQFVETEDLFAQRHIAVHGGHVPVHGFDQVVIHFRGDVLPRHRHGAGGIVMADRRFRRGRLDGPRIRRSKRVDVLAVALVEAGKGIAAQRAVRRHLQHDIVGAGHFHRFPGAVLHRVKDKVGVLQVVRHFRRRPQGFPKGRQQFFFRRAQRVGLLAQQVFQREAVRRQPGVLREGPQRFFRQREDLRLGKRDGCHGLHIFDRDAGIHPLPGLGAGILAAAQRSVAIQVGQRPAKGRGGVQVIRDGPGVPQRTGKRRQLFQLGVQRRKFLFPRGVVLIHRRKVPLVLRVHGAAFLQHFGIRHTKASFISAGSFPIRPP